MRLPGQRLNDSLQIFEAIHVDAAESKRHIDHRKFLLLYDYFDANKKCAQSVNPHRLQNPRRLKRRKGIGDDVAGLAIGSITEIEQMVAGAVESLVNRQTGRYPGLDNSIPGNPRPHVGDVYQIRRAKLAIDSTLLRHAALSELCTCDRIIRSS